MWTHLELVNFCIGAQKGYGALPTPFGSQGHELVGVGVGFSLGGGGLISPDVLLHAAPRRRTLLVEVKSGKTLDVEQLARYRRCTAGDIRDRGFCHVPSVSSHIVEPLYVINSGHLAPIQDACEREHVKVPLLSVSDSGFQLVGPALDDADLDRALRTGGTFAPEDFPFNFFVPLDEKSTRGEAVLAVLPVVVAMIDGGLTRFKPGDVVARLVSTINPEVVRAIGEKSPERGMNRIVQEVLEDVAANELSGWLEKAGGQGFFSVKQSIPRIDRQVRTRQLRSIRAAVRSAVARIQSGVRQLPLFEDKG